MATSNPASISRFAEIGRQKIIAEAHRQRLALEAVRGRSQVAEVDEPDSLDVPVIGVTSTVVGRVRAVVLGWLGRREAAVGRP